MTRRIQPQHLRNGRPGQRSRLRRQQRRTVTQQELNHFLRTPHGRAKLTAYRNQALDAQRRIAHPRGEAPLPSLRAKRTLLVRSKRLIKLVTGATSVVTGLMGGFVGGFIGMMTGGLPSGPEMLASGAAHPAVHFFQQGHFMVGAVVGVGAALLGGGAAILGLNREVRKVDQQADAEALSRVVEELETGVDPGPPSDGLGGPGGRRGGPGNGGHNILNDFFGSPGALFSSRSASDRASMGDNISSSWDNNIGGPPGGPP